MGFLAGQVGYRYLGVFESGDVLQIILLLPDDPVRALPDRLRTGRRHFIRSLAKMNPAEKDLRADPARFGFDRATKGGVLDMLDHLDRRLTGIFEAPLPAKLVDGLLGITARERRRWWKDGRLRPCGYRTSTRSGTRFHLPVFAVDLIHSLRQDPQIIAQSRQDDALPELHIGTPILETSPLHTDVKI